MTENQIKRLVFLIQNSKKDINRSFYTKNTIGTICSGKYFLGEHSGKYFYIKQEFFVILYIPLIPLAKLLTYEENNETYIIGELNNNDLKKIIPNTSGLTKSGYLDGIIKGTFSWIILIIALGLMFLIMLTINHFR